jgi:hypothetical protein
MSTRHLNSVLLHAVVALSATTQGQQQQIIDAQLPARTCEGAPAAPQRNQAGQADKIATEFHAFQALVLRNQLGQEDGAWPHQTTK